MILLGAGLQRLRRAPAINQNVHTISFTQHLLMIINTRGWSCNKANIHILFMLFNKNAPHIHVPLKHLKILIHDEDNIKIVEVNSKK